MVYFLLFSSFHFITASDFITLLNVLLFDTLSSFNGNLFINQISCQHMTPHVDIMDHATIYSGH